MKFTPGPWEAYIENDESKLKQSYIHATRKGTKFAIGEIFATAVKGEVKANARLIAESPTLLIALKYIIDIADNVKGAELKCYKTAFSNARKAISASEGK